MLNLRKTFAYYISSISLTTLSVLHASELQTFNVPIEDCQNFPGNWSLSPEEIFFALKYATFIDTFQILEFGAGEGTVRLSKLLQKHGIPYEYHTFENSQSYLLNLPNVTFHLYALPPAPQGNLAEWCPIVQSVEIPDLPIADLVIVDGPHGVSRAEWYAKFKSLTRPGTIILIDDFHHFSEFGEALDRNFVYETIIEYNRSHIYPIKNEGLEKIDGVANKCFKIVQVLEIKNEI